MPAIVSCVCYLQVVIVGVTLWGLAGDFVLMIGFNDSIKEVAEQNVGLGVACQTPDRHRTGPFTYGKQTLSQEDLL